jgi:DNA-directed RNA polymerase specialized sigma subunit
MPSEVDDLVSQWKRRRSTATLDQVRSQTAPLVESRIKRFRSSQVSDPVLRAKADEILVSSMKSYDPNRGASFTTHLHGNLRRMGRFTIQRANVAQIPEARAQKIGFYQSVRQNFIDEHHRPPTTDELADELGWPAAEVHRLERELRLDIPSTSLPIPHTLDMTDTAEDQLLRDIWYELTPDEKKVLDAVTGMHGVRKTTEGKALARKLGWSQAKVSQVRTSIARKMEPHLGRR